MEPPQFEIKIIFFYFLSFSVLPEEPTEGQNLSKCVYNRKKNDKTKRLRGKILNKCKNDKD